MPIISEVSAKIHMILPKKDVHSKMEVFYNPLMKSNRNLSVLLLNSIPNQKMNLALPLAGSGIRGIRFLQELKKSKINQIFVNDKKEDFIQTFKDNLKLNKLSKKVNIYNTEN